MSQPSDDIFLRIENALGQWSNQIADAHDQLSQQLSRAKEHVDVPDGGAASSLRKEISEIKDVLLAYHEAAKAQSEQIHRLTESVQDLYRELHSQPAAPDTAGFEDMTRALDTLKSEVSRLDRDLQELGPVRGMVDELRHLIDHALAAPDQARFVDRAELGGGSETRGESDSLDQSQPLFAFTAEGKRRRMGEILVEGRLITAEQLDQALVEQANSPHQRLGAVLVEMGMADPDIIAQVVAGQLQLPYVQLDQTPLDGPTVHRLNSRLALQHKCIPIEATDSELVLAMANPLDLIAIEDIERTTNLRVVPTVASLPDIEQALSRFHVQTPDLS
jgi:hypothetical protein